MILTCPKCRHEYPDPEVDHDASHNEVARCPECGYRAVRESFNPRPTEENCR